MAKFFYFFIFIFMFSRGHSFYQLSEDSIYTYKVFFRGSILLDASFLSQKNQDVQFSFSYTIFPQKYDPNDNSVFKIKISKIKNLEGTHPVFVYVCNYLLDSLNSQIAYGIKAKDDTIVLIDTQSRQHPLSFFMDLFFPIINQVDGYESHSYILDLLYNLGQGQIPAQMTVETEGWHFLNSSRKSKDPYPLLENNKSFLDTLIKKHLKQKKNTTHLPWMQRVEIVVSDNNSGENFVDSSFLGVYSLDLKNKLMKEAEIDADIKAKTQYQYQFISVPLEMSLRGVFSISHTLN